MYVQMLFFAYNLGEPEPLEQQKQQITNEEGTELFSYKGNDVEYFVSSSSPSGLYQLDLLSTEKDTHFKVYTLNYLMIQELMLLLWDVRQ